ncbi:FAD-binding oxidoreductase [Candidatus Micrarchaeota archaeon]|nr:FAD-binding oxidoreductase [Candidatus Micrarchaeota archaeon]
MAIEKYKVMSVDSTVPDVRIFRLIPLSGKVPAFLPGQFMFLHLLDASGASVIRRPYSVASSPSSPYVEFAIDMVGGQMTGRLALTKAGDILGLEGPAGHMVYRGESRAAFVAGGTGISPFMSMLRSVSDKNLQGRFLLFYSTRDRNHIVFSEELQELQKKHPGIKAVITLTREAPGDWHGECGRISHEMISKHLPDAKEFDWWVCGPPGLVKAVRECLARLSVEPKKLKLEGWG